MVKRKKEKTPCCFPKLLQYSIAPKTILPCSILPQMLSQKKRKKRKAKQRCLASIHLKNNKKPLLFKHKQIYLVPNLQHLKPILSYQSFQRVIRKKHNKKKQKNLKATNNKSRLASQTQIKLLFLKPMGFKAHLITWDLANRIKFSKKGKIYKSSKIIVNPT